MVRMNIYYPNPKFPSISVTGEYCALRCKHCNAHYLKGMLPVTTPEKLVEFAKRNEDKINGFLLSGGSSPHGKVPLKRFVKAVRWIRENTDLMVNIHTGIIDDEDMDYLEEMEPHHISFDVIGSTDTIREVIGINRTSEDYFHALHLLDESHLNYSPHIIAGLHYGKILGEYKAIEEIRNLRRFSNIVLLVLVPTRGTPMQNVKLDKKSILEFFNHMLDIFPPQKIVLGCMRPRDFHDIELLCMKKRCKGIVIPSLNTLKMMHRMKMEIVRKDLCCVF